MKKSMFLICFLLCLIVTGAASAGTLHSNVHFSEMCGVDFTMDTQMGKIGARLSVCQLMSEFGPGTRLYVLVDFEKEWPSYVDKIIEDAKSPKIRKKNDRIDIIYVSGANTVCVSTYTLESGLPKFGSTKTISWNDNGSIKKSDDFDEYSELLKSKH